MPKKRRAKPLQTFKFARLNTTRMLRTIFLSALSLALYLNACQSGEQPVKNQEPVAEAKFISQPQPVPHRDSVPTLKIGAPAPDFRLPGVDGKFYTLQSFADAKVLVVVFTCNHCPTAQAYEDRIKAVAADYQSKGVAVVAISPNSPLGLLYEELGYTDLNDDYDEMVIRARQKQFNFPYLYDGDTQATSLLYGPVATPHVFVFDPARKLQYSGRLDAKEKPGAANGEDLRAAIEALLAGSTPAQPVTKTFGCSTKWGWKTESKVKTDEEWNTKPVSIQPLQVKEVQALVKNEKSTKLRLINIWATWCGPCVLEFPNFVVLQRMYGARDFEFVSLSADNPAQQDKALAFLQQKHAALPNYIFDNPDKYALMEAVDKKWNGALPYTLLVEPGGKVVWSHQGEVDFEALKRVIVDHPKIGRYF